MATGSRERSPHKPKLNPATKPIRIRLGQVSMFCRERQARGRSARRIADLRRDGAVIEEIGGG